MENSTVFYEEIKEVLKTGDLILFHGVLLGSEINELIVRSEWSHVGMVIRPEDMGIEESERMLLWKSNALVNLPIIKRGQLLEGPLIYVSEK